MADEKQQKIEQYEEFINEKLKSDLKYVNISIGAELMNDRKLYEQRDKVLDEAAEYHRLGAMLSSIQDARDAGAIGKELETQVDLGNNIFCEAYVEDSTKLFVDIGMGFHVEMTYPEAFDFIEKQTAFLEEKAEKLSTQISELRALIQMVLEGLRELQGIN